MASRLAALRTWRSHRPIFLRRPCGRRAPSHGGIRTRLGRGPRWCRVLHGMTCRQWPGNCCSVRKLDKVRASQQGRLQLRSESLVNTHSGICFPLAGQSCCSSSCLSRTVFCQFFSATSVYALRLSRTTEACVYRLANLTRSSRAAFWLRRSG